MNFSDFLLALSVVMLGVSAVLGKMMYSTFMTNVDKTTKNKLIGGFLSLLSVGAVGATTAAINQNLGPTSFAVQTGGGIIIQGDAKFDVSWDPYGLDPAKVIDWGTIEVGKKYTRTFYTINRGVLPLDVEFSLTNWNWVTTNPANEVKVDMLFEPSSLAPGRFRAVVVEMTLLQPIHDSSGSLLNKFSYDIVLTGTNNPG